ncbi:SMI1/KNR4 family protein [Myroides sp. WP-1]|uniref:SMI1/KNR4 family protein n=1 Tax=Myroides sp. WP-1 TaxID=2759944 RepID=UPI0015FD5615|nr:SMI1/KNR4 family protein [Myroides sp. WP-1]MBB1139125.1 SMI1/KNR4 family protein [Myroides sp. WP-1]
MNSLEDIEKELNIQYPVLYKKLFADGLLDSGPTGINWYKDSFPKLKQNPPLLLFAEDIEIWNPIEYKAGILEILDPEVYDLAQRFQFVPFAKNGAGDLYVFQFDLQDGNDIPITFFPHDDCEVEVVAKNLQDFIFRQLVEATREIDDCSLVFEEEEVEIKANFQQQLRTHRPYLSERQIEILEEIYTRDLNVYTYTLPSGRIEKAEGLTTYEEVDNLLQREIDFKYLNAKFDYTV